MAMVIGGAGLLFAVLGVAFFIMGRSSGRVKDPAGWVTVPGRIVDSEYRPSSIDATQTMIRLPVVEYPLPDGRLDRFTNPTSIGFEDMGSAGTDGTVKVLVDPGNPLQAQLASTANTHQILNVAFMAFGALFALVGIMMLIVAGAILWLANR